MTNGLAYDVAGYRRMVKMSSSKYILVEGRDDKTLIKYLLHECFDKNRKSVIVHSAEQIRHKTAISNREKVELVSDSFKGKDYANRFVGFVDREFRAFEFGDSITDIVKGHKIIDRLIWSRGHSIENYYFDFAVLRRTLRNFSVTPYFDEALDLFEPNLDTIIRFACATGLAALDCGMLKPVRGSVDWNIIELDSSRIVVSTSKWSKNLISKQKVDYDRLKKFMEKYIMWLDKVNRSDVEAVRWACHGHIGMTFIWACYARCIFEVCSRSGSQDPQNEARNVLRADEAVRFNGCANEWAQKASNDCCEYPMAIFEHLNLML